MVAPVDAFQVAIALPFEVKFFDFDNDKDKQSLVAVAGGHI